VFRTARVAVFIDGCFWHGCTEHHRLPSTNVHYWESKVAKNRARDQDIDRMLTAADWTVLRFWEHESVDEVVDRIVDAVTSRQRQA
jgi:DNA mismatch endonuclease (patch repair protein)